VAGYLTNVRTHATAAFTWTPNLGFRVLHVPAGAASTMAKGINAAGSVVGYAEAADGSRWAILWDANGDAHEIGAAHPANQSQANGINDAGQVVGWMSGATAIVPFLWTSAQGIRKVGDIQKGIANAISENGEVVGQAGENAFVWSPVSGFWQLPGLPHGAGTNATAISSAGEVVGWSAEECAYYDEDCPEGEHHAVHWSLARGAGALSAQPVSVGPLTVVAGVNSSNSLVGTTLAGRALRWSLVSSEITDLGVLARRYGSAASAINEAGIVVGVSFNP
jgi:probable HAF family extracellular repeat protein